MKKYLRIIQTLLLIAALCLPLVSCHGSAGKSAFEVPESFDTSRNYEITFWAKNDTNLTQKKIYEKVVADFEEAYPNIKVTIKSYTDYAAIYNDVITNIPTDTTPNVCISYPDHIATYLTGSNTVVPLDDLIVNEKYGFCGSELKYDGVGEEGVAQKFLDEGVLDGSQYLLPFMRSSEACYINRNLVEALGYEIPDVLTWDFVWEVCDAAINLGKDENGNYKLNGQKTLIPFIYKSTDNMMIQMTEQRGTGYSTEYGKILLFNDSTKEILSTVAKHVANKSFLTFAIASYPGNYLNANQCLFAIDSTAGSTWMGCHAPLQDIPEGSIREFETLVRAIPQFDTENPKMISQGPSICIFNKDDPHVVLASWLFAQALLSEEVQLAYAETEGYVPVTNSALNSDAYKEYLSLAGTDYNEHYDVKINASKIVLDNIDNTFITPVFNGSASLREAAGELIESTVRQIRKGKEADEEYYEKLYSDVISLKRLNVDGNAADAAYDLGPLPKAAKTLIFSVCFVWVLIIAYASFTFVKKKRKNKKD